MTSKLPNTFARDGFAVIDGLLDHATVGGIISEIEARLGKQSHGRAGARNLHRTVPAVADLIGMPPVSDLIQQALPGAFPIRSILFDKTPETNWKVAWHQDLTICTRERIEVEGFGPWSIKDGVSHVQPPASILHRVVTLRIHLDDCGKQNGPLLVLPGSHKEGRLSGEEIARWRRQHTPVPCVVGRGGVVLMKPLLLHASSEAQTPSHRRVIHIELAAEDLPFGLKWLK